MYTLIGEDRPRPEVRQQYAEDLDLVTGNVEVHGGHWITAATIDKDRMDAIEANYQFLNEARRARAFLAKIGHPYAGIMNNRQVIAAYVKVTTAETCVVPAPREEEEEEMTTFGCKVLTSCKERFDTKQERDDHMDAKHVQCQHCYKWCLNPRGRDMHRSQAHPEVMVRRPAKPQRKTKIETAKTVLDPEMTAIELAGKHISSTLAAMLSVKEQAEFWEWCETAEMPELPGATEAERVISRFHWALSNWRRDG